MRETRTCRLAVSGQGDTPVFEPDQQGVVGEVAEGLAVTGEGDAPVGQVDVAEGEFADGPGTGGVHGC
jgi:hypothetical protein